MSEKTQDIGKCQYPDACAQAVLELAQNTRRQLCLLSPTLDPALFDSEDLARALVALLRRHRGARVHILINDNTLLIKRKHQLALIAQRLSSNIEIRILAEHPSWRGDTVVIADKHSYLHLQDQARYGQGKLDTPALTQSHVQRFTELWNAATVDPEFRVLSFM